MFAKVTRIGEVVSHNCGTTCKRKTGERCDTCRVGGQLPVALVLKEDSTRHRHATPQEIGAAVDMYFDGLSYRRTAEHIGDYFGRTTDAATVFRWVKNQTAPAKEVIEDSKVEVGSEWVADELQVRLGGEK